MSRTDRQVLVGAAPAAVWPWLAEDGRRARWLGDPGQVVRQEEPTLLETTTARFELVESATHGTWVMASLDLGGTMRGLFFRRQDNLRLLGDLNHLRDLVEAG